MSYVVNYFFFEKIIYSEQYNGASKVNRIIHKNNINETAIFGSSRAEGSYVPSILGENYYNYGIKSTQADVWLFFLEKELEKEKNSDIIINFDIVGLNYEIGDPSSYIPNYPITKELMALEGKFYYNLPFIKYFGRYEIYSKFHLRRKFDNTKLYDNGARFENVVLTKAEIDKLVIKRENTKTSFSIENKLLEKFIKLIRSTNRQVFLVVAPYHPSYMESFKNLNQTNKFLLSINKLPNLTVIDMTSNVYNDSLFLDTSHLNYKGAMKFSKELRKRIKIIKKVIKYDI